MRAKYCRQRVDRFTAGPVELPDQTKARSQALKDRRKSDTDFLLTIDHDRAQPNNRGHAPGQLAKCLCRSITKPRSVCAVAQAAISLPLLRSKRQKVRASAPLASSRKSSPVGFCASPFQRGHIELAAALRPRTSRANCVSGNAHFWRNVSREVSHWPPPVVRNHQPGGGSSRPSEYQQFLLLNAYSLGTCPAMLESPADRHGRPLPGRWTSKARSIAALSQLRLRQPLPLPRPALATANTARESRQLCVRTAPHRAERRLKALRPAVPTAFNSARTWAPPVARGRTLTLFSAIESSPRSL